ncbi:LptF/LptG family permease [Membranihabitans maritimus]|uniref:LptF/LptG family permease n=1 Tax=Membranihabitans maritimus TaxID=2904244 RepID=UPI001F42FDD8|nr:LptF/LptG family permease [Membranihabitans maritimus]
MKIIDRYILGKFLKTFFFTVLLSSAISVVFDLSEKIQKIMDADIPAVKVISEYFIPFIMYIDSTVWPIFILISVIFFTSRMAKNSEILSILNAGVSFKRFLYPYIVGGIIVAGLHFVANHLLIPFGEQYRIIFLADYIDKNNREVRDKNIQQMLTPESMIYIKTFRHSDTTGYDVQLEKMEDGALTEIIKANKMEIDEPPFKWRLYDYSIRSFDGDNQSVEQFKNKWLDTTLYIKPGDFIRIKDIERTYTTFDLLDRIEEEQLKGFSAIDSFWIEIHRRTADAVTSFILAILAVCVASRKVRGGLGWHLATGILIGATFILLSKFSITFANSNVVHPALGVWIPNIVFGAITFLLFKKAQK